MLPIFLSSFVFRVGGQIGYFLLCQSQNHKYTDICFCLFFRKENFNGFLRETKCKNFLWFLYYSFWDSFRIVFQYYADFKWHLWFFCSVFYFKSSRYAIILSQITPLHNEFLYELPVSYAFRCLKPQLFILLWWAH